MNIQLPFVGREKEIARLRQLHKQRKNVLLLGGEGIGKSALIEQLREPLDLWVCPHSEHLGEICESLERELNLKADDLHLVKRKNRILKSLKEKKDVTVVFDNANWTTPKLGSFMENVSERVPVWLCLRSNHPWDVGRIWPLLVRFEHVELKPFNPKQTQKLVAAAVRENIVPEKTSGIVDRLQRRSEGYPQILCELLTEIAHGHYDLNNSHSLRLLDLDRRIHKIFPLKTDNEKMALNE